MGQNESKQSNIEELWGIVTKKLKDQPNLNVTVNENKLSNTTCICGKPLQKSQASSVYNGKVICDKCARINSWNDFFWHCTEGQTTQHEGGYDICDYCIIHHCNLNLQNCPCYTQLCVNINQYNATNTSTSQYNIDQKMLSQIINDYIHVLHFHDSDEEFEFIVNQFKPCDISKCKIFKRNYRDRFQLKNTYNMNSIINFNDITYREIMDKIHTCFQHCYDIGHRLSIKESKIINEEKKDHVDDSSVDTFVVNNKIVQMKKLLSEKMNLYHKLCEGRSSVKYSQLCPKVADNEEKSNSFNANKDMLDVYHFGYKFKYGYEHEYIHSDKEYIQVKPKYSSLKIELTSNNLQSLTIDQFNSEYLKAQVHFNSFYCKQNFSPKLPNVSGQTKTKEMIHFDLNQVLSIMVYCNYDVLQNVFSKTFRENNGADHSEFYHLGKYLAIAAFEFGSCYKGELYHGIGEPLLFSHIEQIDINCPTSTSSSLDVALNFTNNNNGIVITLTTEERIKPYDVGSVVGGRPASCFSTAWLSDFASEKEHLFTQTVSYLHLVNIIDPQLGCEYHQILMALKLIDEAFSFSLGHIPKHQEWKQEERLMAIMNQYKSMNKLIQFIISHQLSRQIAEYEPWKSLSKYGKALIVKHFDRKITLKVQYGILKDITWAQRTLLSGISKHDKTKLKVVMKALYPKASLKMN
eukprot:398238_1